MFRFLRDYYYSSLHGLGSSDLIWGYTGSEAVSFMVFLKAVFL
jgi:hypothetical protein